MRLALPPLAALLALAACGEQPEAATGAPAETPTGTAAEGLVMGGDGLPRFREGLWEVTRVEDGEREVTRQCTGAAVREDLRQMLTRETPACKTERASGPAGIRVHAICDQAGGLKTETRLSMSGSATAWNMTLGLHLLTPDGGRRGGETTLTARWIGACPPGVQPGEDVDG